MKIAELARRSGRSAHTIRYYERIGLMPPALRDAAGHRDYGADALVWITFIGHMKAAGMPIQDMLHYARLRQQGTQTGPQRAAICASAAIWSSRRSRNCRPPFPFWTARLPATITKGQIMQSETRYERGQRQLARIDGDAGQAVIEALADIAPDFATYLLEFPFGDIYSRDGLNLRDREIATIAALAAMGTATPQLKVHIQAGLNVGLTRQEITEILMQMAVYAGFPAALNGLFAAKEVFAGEHS